MKYWVTVNGKKFEVEVDQATDGQAVNASGNSSTAAGRTANPAVPASTPAVSPVTPAKPGDGESILAPMPGTILDIKVSEGQSVKKGDVLFILEAMKMENEIMAGHDGTVVKITVASGASVKTGDSLALFK